MLDVRDVRHRGPGPSPLAPPFDGLALGLRARLSEVDDPETVQAAWVEHRRATGRSGPTMNFRELWWSEDDDARFDQSWDIHPPERDGGAWSTYGSFYFAAEARDGEVETDALRAARRRLRVADPALLRRLKFDPEANGTGISARTREDLEAALRILGLRSE
ncbi:MAG: hypothetical protein ACXVFN_13555 [Solirubrobacteraceae bacterium]